MAALHLETRPQQPWTSVPSSASQSCGSSPAPPPVPSLEPSVESPSLSNPSARARFEFEPGRHGAGTKILMVEWEDDASTRAVSGAWTVGWEGKSHVLPAEEKRSADEADADADATESDMSAPPSSSSTSTMESRALEGGAAPAQRQNTHRIFFLLAARKTVPATVTLTLNPTDASICPTVWKTRPLPALYPPGLADASMDGAIKRGRGVLHGMWAKKRLQTLEREIEAEAKTNCEGVALQMAIGEKEWIESNFGLSASPPPWAQQSLWLQPLNTYDAPLSPLTPMTPLSPGGSRLSEKLKGLKLQTAETAVRRPSLRIASPEEADVAVPLCRKQRAKLAGGIATDSTTITTTVQPPQPSKTTSPVSVPTEAMPANPTRILLPQTSSSSAGMMSLGAVLSGEMPAEEPPRKEEEEELFAMPLSPRSPEMTKSPFSFAAEDTMRYLSTQRVL